jgi:septal ring factor EnvC (AmiA/AmiB activator)
MSIWSFLKRPSSGITLPLQSLHDVRVIVPEKLTAQIEDSGYLDFDLQPLTLQEAQRTGLFLLEHLAAALGSYDELTKVKNQLSQVRADHEITRRELRGISTAYDEQGSELSTFKEQYRQLASQLADAKAQLEQTQAQIAVLQDAASYDKEYIAALEKKS